jgi:hypothetical protein
MKLKYNDDVKPEDTGNSFEKGPHAITRELNIL